MTVDETEEITNEESEEVTTTPTDDVLVTINNEKETSLTFQVNIQGIDSNNVDVRFMIKQPEFVIGFPCTPVGGSEYRVHIPALPFVHLGTHQCTIEVIANGYFFTALEGKVKVIETPRVSATISTTTAEDDSEAEDETPTVAVSASLSSTDEKGHTKSADNTDLKEVISALEVPKPTVKPKKKPISLDLLKTLK